MAVILNGFSTQKFDDFLLKLIVCALSSKKVSKKMILLSRFDDYSCVSLTYSFILKPLFKKIRLYIMNLVTYS